MSELPSGWAETTIGEVCEFVRGVTYKKPQARPDPAAGYLPLLRATNIDGSHLLLDEDLVFVPGELVKAEQRLCTGDIVLATSSGSARVVGKSARLSGEWEGTFGAFCGVVRSGPGADSSYLGYFVQSREVRRAWSSAARGTNINNLKRTDVEQTRLPLPPTPEQRRIAEAIEEQFSRLDAGLESLQRAKRNLARLRASVLHATVEKLRGFACAPISSILDTSIGGIWGSEVGTSEIDIRVVRVTEFRMNGVVDPSTAARRSVKRSQLETRLLRSGDLLLEKSGGGPTQPVGRVMRVRESDQPTVCGNFVQLLRCDATLIDPEFLAARRPYACRTHPLLPRKVAFGAGAPPWSVPRPGASSALFRTFIPCAREHGDTACRGLPL